MTTEYERNSKKWFGKFGDFYHTDYKSRCRKCKKPYVLVTQEDDQPEYYTNVAVKCECGGLAYFSLPVN